jgi:Xaa-Pro aminopeptidase
MNKPNFLNNAVKPQLSTNPESVGTEYSETLLIEARDKTLEVILEAQKQIHPGLCEKDARNLVSDIQTRLGAPKSWHPPQIRFGANTLLPFGKVGLENPVLAENDIYFLDIGPIFNGHEGDVGRTFSVGKNPLMHKCVHDVEAIWNDVRHQWKEFSKTGADLYQYAQSRAQELGWILNLEKANGHRISDFPHAAKMRGSIDILNFAPTSNRWILEIQIRHSELPIGAFYEDLLS